MSVSLLAMNVDLSFNRYMVECELMIKGVV